jgi:hypothetical protein
MLAEKLAELLVKQDAIGVDLNVEVAQAVQRVFKLDENGAQPRHSGQERLAAVQHDLDAIQRVRLDMLGDPQRRAGNDAGRNRNWTAPPTLVGALVHITVIAGEIAPTVHLKYELIRRDERAAVHAESLSC